MTFASGSWPSPWPAEDGGPTRLQAPHGRPGLGLRPGERLVATSRDAIAATMVVLREPGEVFLLRHTGGDGSIAWVEWIDPITFEVLDRSPDLRGGPTWPGGLACHADGSLHVVFGRHAHRIRAADLAVEARRELPRNRPYNSFVTLPDGHLVTKDLLADGDERRWDADGRGVRHAGRDFRARRASVQHHGHDRCRVLDGRAGDGQHQQRR